MKTPASFVRSPHVIGYWEGNEFVLHNFATGGRVIGGTALHAVASACTTESTVTQIETACPHLSSREVGLAIARLVRQGLLLCGGVPRPEAERAMDALSPWNPEAGFFHMASKQVAFGAPAEAERAYGARVDGRRPPASVKRHPGRPRIPLPVSQAATEFPATLRQRRTHRRFSQRPLTRHELGHLLQFTGGVQLWVADPPAPRLALRTSPSGGARHPIELYVLIESAARMSPGLYHYASDRHELEHLTHHHNIARYLPHQSWFHQCAAVVFFVARFSKTLWRYPYSRAYRAVLIDAGHLSQTFCLTATWLGLAPFCTVAVADKNIEDDLGLDGISESVVFAAGVGARSDEAHPMTPPGAQAPVVTPNPVFSQRKSTRRSNRR